jgi:diguanylate cyclase (GGDEF)-like protein
MKLHAKVSVFFAVLSVGLAAAVVAIGLYSFRTYTIATATEQMRTAAEIVRVALTESMINGVIAQRAGLLERLMEVQGLRSARVMRGPLVEHQFGKGMSREQPADEIESRVLAKGQPEFMVTEDEAGVGFRGTIPFVANSKGTPNCLQCHQVPDGSVLGAVTITMSIEKLRQKAILTVELMVLSVALFSLVAFLLFRRVIHPVVETAVHVEDAVQRAIDGDYKGKVDIQTKDEIGQIGSDMNRLLSHLDQGLSRIGYKVAQLTDQSPNSEGKGNLLKATIDMVDTLTEAAHFKQAIEEDETQAEIYGRLSVAIENHFGIKEYSIYEVLAARNQMMPMVVDGDHKGPCRWCDPQILIRNEACRARRTGHLVDGIASPGICYAFRPSSEAGERAHLCFPIMQSGSVGSVLQVIVPPSERQRVSALIPHISVYLREAAPVLEAKRLMETLRESTLRDALTGLHNRRFLEESVESLVAQAQRHGMHMAILMADLDFFKMVNDEHGHDAGDAVLKALGKVLAQSVRSSDHVIRYGGEEFLIVLQETTGALAVAVAEKIRVRVEEMKVQIAGKVLQKTISFGIADFPGDSDTFWQTVKFADVALYRAKETGRNRVVRFGVEMWNDKKEY